MKSCAFDRWIGEKYARKELCPIDGIAQTDSSSKESGSSGNSIKRDILTNYAK